MKHQLLLSIFAILFAANTLVAQETPLMKRAKEFVAMENTASISIRDLMTEDFIDQTDDSNKAKFLKKIQERDAHFKNIRQAMKEADNRKMLQIFYKDSPKNLKKIEGYSVSKIGKVARKHRKEYKNFDSDRAKENKSLKVTKVKEKGNSATVTVFMVNYIGGKPDVMSESYELLLTRTDASAPWKIKSLISNDME